VSGEQVKITDFHCYPYFELLQTVDCWTVDIVFHGLLTRTTLLDDGEENMKKLHE
jgi:hypothetical protein